MSCLAIDQNSKERVGRYTIYDQLAAGGMATVHLARLIGSAGFSRVVAAKRMHRHFLSEPDFKQMFVAEAQLAARVQHPNVVPILDVLAHQNELIIVMDYVHGEALHVLMRSANRVAEPIPMPISCALLIGVLQGLHAAHEARDEAGEPLGIVHRDVSPQNILVGADGVTRVVDFGIAKAFRAQNHTDPGTLKGKFSYMSPEVVHGTAITRQADVFSAGVILWELLSGRKLFDAASDQERLTSITDGNYPSPRKFNAKIPVGVERVVLKALQVGPEQRYSTALEFAIALERVAPVASQRVVGEWVQRLAAGTLSERNELIHRIEAAEIEPPERLSLSPSQSLAVPSQSLAVPTRRDRGPPSVLTIVAAPVAKRLESRRLSLSITSALGVAGFAAIVTAIGSFVALRPRPLPTHVALDNASVPAATTGPKNIPGATVPADAPHPPRIASPQPLAEVATTTTPVDSAQPATEAIPTKRAVTRRKPSQPQSAVVQPKRSPTPTHAKPYLPNEL